jgi:hypothetical protein
LIVAVANSEPEAAQLACPSSSPYRDDDAMRNELDLIVNFYSA